MVGVDRLLRTARTWIINSLNSAVYAASGGRKTLHEGRYESWRDTWTNWSRTFEAQPQRFERPTREEDLCRVVREATRLRVVGGGHSFNASPLSQGTLLSLDDYDQVLSVDAARAVVRVQAGIRLRDLTEQLERAGLALPVLGSHNTQSLGGLVATDLHGTGRDLGFLSEQILSLRIVDAAGRAQTHARGSDTFHAAIGGIGTCGVVTEVELQCVPAFNLEKSLQILDRRTIHERIDQLLAQNDHISFYYIGGVDVANVRMNVWNRTATGPDPGFRIKKAYYELLDMLVSGYLLGLSNLLTVADVFSALGLGFFKATMDGRVTVFPAAVGFSRKLFYHHDEIEYAVPFEAHKDCLAAVLALLEQERFVTIVEVRFTPDTSAATLGPGAGRRSCFIELAPSLSMDNAAVFARVEQVFLEHGGRPHLGKKTNVTGTQLAALYQERWTKLLEVQRRQDPGGKFQNDFTARLFDVERTAVEAAASAA